MLRLPAITFAAALAVSAAIDSSAQTPRPAAPPASGRAQNADAEFAQKAAAGGMKEVAAGKLVAGKATNAEVKAYGSRLAKDHGTANQELTKLMKSKKIMAAHEDKAEPETWKSESGASFDRAFLDHAIADHQKDITLFETEANSGSDPELKAFAAKTLPTLREHLKMAEDLKSKLATTK